MKTVIATIIEKNEYRIKIDVENDATEDEIWDAVEEVYWKDIIIIWPKWIVIII